MRAQGGSSRAGQEAGVGTEVGNAGRSSVVPCGKHGRGKASGLRRGWLVWFGQTRKRK